MSNAAKKTSENKATGPRTEAGKARSCWNARRHNLTGLTIVTTEEERVAHNESLQRLTADLQPVGELEIRTVQSLADAQFQLDRARVIEANMFFELTAVQLPTDSDSGEGLEIAQAQTRAFLENGKQFDLIGRYANRFHRQVMQLTAAFLKIRAERRELAAEEEEFVSQERIRAVLNAPMTDAEKADIKREIRDIRETHELRKQKAA